MNKKLDWVTTMEKTLSLEASTREKELALKKDTIKADPLNKLDLHSYDFIAYTDGACRRRKDGNIGSAAYVLYN